ncbi:hypothetical protein WSM22_15060 [Cytophagales bacterium WSM2-2]|nr:hypothetical protein WSM22_15060 [Cytophagales bacterium WSM2-2]
MFGLKGVKTEPQLFSAQATTISIVEILVFLLVACLLGYAIAWSIRGETIEEQQEITEKLSFDNASLLKSATELKNHVEMVRAKYQEDIGTSRHRIHELNIERDNLQQRLIELESIILSKQDQNTNEIREQLEKLETEAGTLRYKIRQLEYQNKEHETANVKLKHEIEALQVARKGKSSSDHPFVRPVEPDEKDDLTSIKGIGPFIEKRLNMLGIYTFKQLSELTPELIDRVGNAIEFFPGRIERENWIGQAQAFTQQRA